MSELNSALLEYVYDTENPQKNLRMASLYERMGQLAGAISFYTRAAERTIDKNLQYYCILKTARCFEQQQGRNNTVRGLYKHCIYLLPDRPEAYFLLSRHYEQITEYSDSYLFAELALRKADFSIEPFYDTGYPGKYGILFEKAVSAWWWGKAQESRNIFKHVADEYREELKRDRNHLLAVQNNIMRLGLTNKTQAIVRYDKNQFNLFRHKFPGLESITSSYSQAMQDMFVLCATNGLRNGTYLEIGAADAVHNNNTYLLEKAFGWNGVSLEIDKKFAAEHEQKRSHKFICDNALSVDYDAILKEIARDNVVDYLQLDCEPSAVTYEVLTKIPFDRYKFRVVTFEHDHYADIENIYRSQSRSLMQSNGYVLVVPDVSVDGAASFEDWYVHKDLVDTQVLEALKIESVGVVDIYRYFTNQLWYAEFQTDKYVRETFFPDYRYKGVFVDVGAGPPQFISNSCHFKQNGWRTIAIEPNPKFAKQHRNAGNEVYEAACADYDGTTDFTVNLNKDEWYSEENDGVSFSAIEVRYNNVPKHNEQKKINVHVAKLDTILQSYSVESVDVLSIDTEGWELDVLRGFDVDRYAPKVIIIENFEKRPDYEAYMNGIGYTKHVELGHNHIYVESEKTKTEDTPSPKEFIPAFSNKNRNRLWIVDDFYDNPDEVRQFALNQTYFEGGFGRGFIGRRTEKQFLFPGLKERFETIMGRKIEKWEEHWMNGRFQLSWAGEALVYHCDEQKWGGMLYLTPDAPFEAGTTLYAHKKSRVRDYYDPRWPEVFPTTETTHLDKTPFEPVDVAGNVYNRLVIFDASSIHSASEYFGQDHQSGRLWQMFFFD